MSSTPPTPGSDEQRGPRIGVLGAGQLGRMLALAGYPLNAHFLFVDPSPGSPASELAPQLALAYDHPEAIEQLSNCDVVTYEFESVPVEATRSLEGRTAVHPSSFALATAQDRLNEKECFRGLGIPTAPFVPVSTEAELRAAVEQVGLPAVLKTRRFGYDGKGQRVLRSGADIDEAWRALGGVPLLLEGFVVFERELSIIGVRNRRGDVAFYPLVENEHRDGILRVSRVPSSHVDRALQAQAARYSQQVLEYLQYVGVLTLELFQIDGRLYANEMAPRVHNSGHFSIEGARTSQFENHLRAVLDLPLGSTEVPEFSAMLNIIGELPPSEAVLATPGAHLHLYDKAPRPGRKLGHITLCSKDRVELERHIAAMRELPGVG